MGRNYKKNRNIVVPLGRDSETLKALEEDAERYEMSSQIGKFVALRLAEYYQLKRAGRILPEGATAPAAMLPYGMGYPLPPAGAWGTPALVPSETSAPLPVQPAAPRPTSGPSEEEIARLADRPQEVDLVDTTDLDDDGFDYFLEEEEDDDG